MLTFFLERHQTTDMPDGVDGSSDRIRLENYTRTVTEDGIETYALDNDITIEVEPTLPNRIPSTVKRKKSASGRSRKRQ
jgi:hypothetical protein